jgi:hypothetical protein
MPRPFKLSQRELTKWCLYVLVLLTPGSFVALPAVWLVRLYRANKAAGRSALRLGL